MTVPETPGLQTDNQAYLRWWWTIDHALRERIEHHLTSAHQLRQLASNPPIEPQRFTERRLIREAAGETMLGLAKQVGNKCRHSTIKKWEEHPVQPSPKHRDTYQGVLRTMAADAADEHLALAAINTYEADLGGCKVWDHIPEDNDLDAWLSGATTKHQHLVLA